jgi:hypothetical protein
MVGPSLLRTPAETPGLVRLDAAFRAVELALHRLGIDRPHTLRSPRPVEEVLDPTGPLAGTLLVLDPGELRAAEIDVEETVADERAGGTLFVNLPNPSEMTSRRTRYRDLATAASAFAFIDEPGLPPGFGKFKAVERPKWLRRYRLLLADTPGFRVAVASRAYKTGGFIGLWTGAPEIVDEVSDLFRGLARAAGHPVPDAAPPVPSLAGIARGEDVWKQAAQLRGLREVREAELREIARAAALRGVALRRERARAGAA